LKEYKADENLFLRHTPYQTPSDTSYACATISACKDTLVTVTPEWAEVDVKRQVEIRDDIHQIVIRNI
jgi:hypothetical protein